LIEKNKMNVKIVMAGAVLELGYLIHLVLVSMPNLSITPMFLEFTKHTLFQVAVLVLILVGAFMNGKKKEEKKEREN